MEKVLIIESISSITKNFEVKTAINGVDGVNLALVFLPDLIFCDVSLPDLDVI